jgi:hypothetical protein
MHGEMRNAFRIFVGKPEEKRPLGRPKNKWEDYIIMGLKEIGWKDVDWIHLAQGWEEWQAVVDTVMNIRVP